MKRSLTAQFFGAFVATAAAIIAMLAAAVVWSMHDGFARYLLNEELGLFSDMTQTLGAIYDPDQPGWPHLTADPIAWRDFVAAHYAHPKLPDEAIDTGGPPPLEAKLFLLDAKGAEIIAPQMRGEMSETVPIYTPCGSEHLVGWLGLTSLSDVRVDTTSFFLKSQYRNLFFVSLAALLLSSVAAILLGRRLVEPIKAVAAGARQISDGDLNVRVPERGEDELGQLIKDTNTMAQSLEKAHAAEKQWISDTSHELQTPLAVLRAQIEAIEDGIDPADHRTLGQMHAAVMRLSQLVEDIKTLSFADEGKMLASGQAELLDMSVLLKERVYFAQPCFNGADIQVDLVSSTQALVIGNAKRLSQVIDNLLENACRYTDAPGQLRIRLSAEQGQIHLRFDDTGPAPPSEAITHLFDRFYRADTSRSRALGGSGLGLAICKAIIAAHGGEITAGASQLGGLSVSITLPDRSTQDAPA